MALGKPAIPTPNRIDLRALQTAIANTRERIEALEAALATAQSSIITTQNSTASTTSAAQIAALQSQITALSNRVTILESITLYDLIEEQSAMSGAEAGMAVPTAYAGAGWRVSAYDIAALLMTHSPYSSGTPPSNALVPVQLANGQIVLVNAGDIGGGSTNLEALIDALAASSGAEADAQIPGTRGGVAYRFSAYDIANLLLTHSPYSSGSAPSDALVPVRLASGLTVLVSVGDISGGAANLQALIDALSAMSGVDARMMLPATIGGAAYRVNAFDIAALLFTHAPYNSGAESSALVPVQLSNGQIVLVTASDLAGLGFHNPMTSAGDLIYGDVLGAPLRLPIGASGRVLTVVSGAPAWAVATGFANPMTTTGDIIYSSDNSGTAARLAIGATGQVLTVIGGVPGWATPASGGISIGLAIALPPLATTL